MDPPEQALAQVGAAALAAPSAAVAGPLCTGPVDSTGRRRSRPLRSRIKPHRERGCRRYAYLLGEHSQVLTHRRTPEKETDS